MGCKGIDVSNWNSVEQVSSLLQMTGNDKIEFVLIKATEGRTWKDTKAVQLLIAAMQYGVAIGFYHYCRPELGNDAKEEATHFVSTVRDICYQAGYMEDVLLVADYEDKAIGHGLWLANFLREVDDQTGGNPMVYTTLYGSETSDLIHVNTVAYGLWIATRGKEKDNPFAGREMKNWKLWAIHQYAVENGIDMNYFNGTRRQLFKYFNSDPHLNKETDAGCCEHCMCCRD